MKKYLFILSAAVLGLAGCCQSFSYTAPEALAPEATNGDEFLYTMTIKNFDFDKAVSIAPDPDENKLEAAGCSSVRKGNLHGRNLDFYINDHADIIIRTEKAKNTLASIGTCTCNPKLTKQGIDEGAYTDEMWESFPLQMTDGINECGVCLNVNVVPLGECDKTVETNPGAPELSVVRVVRYILDKATSVDNAVELLKSHNLTGVSVLPFDYHWMISDAEKTVVVEIWNNEVVVTPSNMMTNFYVSHPDTPFGEGHERWDILTANYDEAVDVPGMWSLMKKVWYAQCYDPDYQPRWYSDFLSNENPSTYQDILAGNTAALDETYMPLAIEYGSIEKQKALRAPDNMNWYTTHSIVYDLAAKEMHLIAQENETVWDFAL